MKKSRTKSSPRKALSPSGRSASKAESTPPWALSPRARLLEVVLAKGFEGVMQILEEDREALCGPARRWQVGREAYRHGFDEGQLVLGGRTVKLRKPRVRTIEGAEVELPAWGHFAEEDPLRERVLRQVLAGVSTRSYGDSLEDIPEELQPGMTSSSSVSRRFVAVTRHRMKEFLSRSLTDLDLPVILIDGTGFGEHLLVIALGIDVSGQKHVLGVVEGTTEGEEVCKNLMRDLVERGLKVERARLFVLDGGKGVRKAVRTTFGEWGLVQRCQIHKLRNILDHLPQHRRAWVRAAIRKAWAEETPAKAKGKLVHLAEQLESDHPGAAASIREGLEETLTLIRLGVRGSIHKTLSSTNAIENLIGRVKKVSRNVKRWRGGGMVLRWAATGLIESEKKFRRIKGHREMSQLVAALEATISMDKKQKVA